MSQLQFNIKTARSVLFQPPLLSRRAASPWSRRSAWRGGGPLLACFTLKPSRAGTQPPVSAAALQVHDGRAQRVVADELLAAQRLVGQRACPMVLQPPAERKTSGCPAIPDFCHRHVRAQRQAHHSRDWHRADVHRMAHSRLPLPQATCLLSSRIVGQGQLQHVAGGGHAVAAIQRRHGSDDLPCDAALEQSIADECFSFHVLL